MATEISGWKNRVEKTTLTVQIPFETIRRRLENIVLADMAKRGVGIPDEAKIEFEDHTDLAVTISWEVDESEGFDL